VKRWQLIASRLVVGIDEGGADGAQPGPLFLHKPTSLSVQFPCIAFYRTAPDDSCHSHHRRHCHCRYHHHHGPPRATSNGIIAVGPIAFDIIMIIIIVCRGCRRRKEGIPRTLPLNCRLPRPSPACPLPHHTVLTQIHPSHKAARVNSPPMVVLCCGLGVRQLLQILTKA